VAGVADRRLARRSRAAPAARSVAHTVRQCRVPPRARPAGADLAGVDASAAAAFVDHTEISVDCGSQGHVELAANIPTAQLSGTVTEQPAAVQSTVGRANTAGHTRGNTVG
jgi:hypothetical protein